MTTSTPRYTQAGALGRPPIVAIQGEHGAYSHEASQRHFGPVMEILSCRTFEELFAAVENGQADYGVVPVENSTAGSINKSYDLLLEHDLKVTGEILVRVRHCLMVNPGYTGEIVQVRSHPQALAQCEGYLNKHRYIAVPWYDTAGSAKDLAATPAPGVAVIASKLAAEVYGLQIVEEGIEDLTNNYTRFFVIGRTEVAPAERNKTSLIFVVAETPGALWQALGEFAKRGINLSKIESRPRRNRLWHYVFYLDLAGHWRDEAVGAAILALLSQAAYVKMLGSYPAASSLEAEKNGSQEALLQI
jgi:prephenate dehydratase